MSYKNEMVGNIVNNKFWITKTKINFFYPTMRAFEGIIYSKNGKTVIQGKFKYSFLQKFIVVIFSSIPLWSVLKNSKENINFQKIWSGLLGFFILFILCIGASYLNVLIHRKDEEKIINLVKKIFMSEI